MSAQLQPHQVAVSPGALRAMEESGQEWEFFFEMHLTGIWSDEDCCRNRDAAAHGEPLITSYRTLLGRELLVATDTDRALTTIFLVQER
jgi:hypothetical protein